jgi:hypothetical protein
MLAQSRITGSLAIRVYLESKRWLLMIAACALLLSGPLQAKDKSGAFVVTDGEVELGEAGWLLNVWIDIKLSKGAYKALENGVPLVFEFHVQTLEKHPWLWDRVIEEQRQMREVQYHPLSRTFIVTNITTGEQRDFRRLEEAIQFVGILQNINVLDYAAAGDNRDYAVRLRGSLDIESLPTPIRLQAYIYNKWDMKNAWQQWSLER